MRESRAIKKFATFSRRNDNSDCAAAGGGGEGQRPRNELLYASATAIDFDFAHLHDRSPLFSTAQAVLIEETITPAASCHPCVTKQKTTLPLAESACRQTRCCTYGGGATILHTQSAQPLDAFMVESAAQPHPMTSRLASDTR